MQNFDQIALQLSSDAVLPVASQMAQFQRLCPDIVRQVETDSGPSGPLIFWGQCRNVDEFAGTVIVQPPILELIFRFAKQTLVPENPHAGLQHTYGYLFSVIETPFGKKRDRWVSDRLERALSLPVDVLSPIPSSGTLLANATWLAGNIAFRGHSRRKWLRRCLGNRVAPLMRQVEIDGMPRLRSIETIKLRRPRGRLARVSLVTDLVRLPLVGGGSEPATWLLVYSVDDDRNRHPEIVTLFTVSDEFAQGIRERSAKRKLSDIRLRYNAWVPGFPPEPQAGTVALKLDGDQIDQRNDAAESDQAN